MNKPVFFLQIDEAARRTVVLGGDTELAGLHFPKWHSSRAVSDTLSLNMEVKPSGWMGNKFELLQNGSNHGTISFNWKHQAKILVKAERFGRDLSLLLKPKGFMKRYYELSEVDSGDLIFRFKQTSKWYRRTKEFEVEPIAATLQIDTKEVLLFAAFCIRQLEKQMAAAAM